MIAIMEFRRVNITYRIDERVAEEVKNLAHRRGQSANNYVEMHFVRHLQTLGLLPEDFRLIGEARGRKGEKGQSDGKKAYQLLAEKVKRPLTKEEAAFIVDALPEYELSIEQLLK